LIHVIKTLVLFLPEDGLMTDRHLLEIGSIFTCNFCVLWWWNVWTMFC